jgi:heterodisulfide reductase subunit A
MLDVASNPNIRLITYSKVKSIDGNVGNFEVTIEKKARYVLEDKCNACGDCETICPVYAPNEFDLNLGPRKAIYRAFPQAVPSIYTIDDTKCIKCGLCVKVCEQDAIDLEMKTEYETINVGSVIIATGFETFDPTGILGYGKYKNVITQLELERMLAPNGPTIGELVRPSDKKHPKRVLMIQCVGSRNLRNNPHCSSGVCCMVAIKNAGLIKGHDKDTEVYIAYMDIRAAGKNYEEYYLNSRKTGVKYIRGSVAYIKETEENNLIVKIENTLSKTILDLEVDLVILSVAMVPSTGSKEIAEILGLEEDQAGFLKEFHSRLDPISTKIPGVYICGAAQGPKSIAESVMQGKAAASLAKIPVNNKLVELKLLKAFIDPERCSKCEICMEACPYNSISYNEEGIPTVNEVLCKGCGTCVSVCRSKSINLRKYREIALETYIDGVFKNNKNQ